MKKPEHKFTYEVKFMRALGPDKQEEQIMSSGSYYEQTHFIFQRMKSMLENFFMDGSRTKLTFVIERDKDESRT